MVCSTKVTTRPCWPPVWLQNAVTQTASNCKQLCHSAYTVESVILALFLVTKKVE